MIKILLVIFFLTIEAILLWDFILQLAGLNEDLSENNCNWQKKNINHSIFFPKKNKRRSFKKVTPEYLYTIVFAFQISLYVLFLVSLINSFICLVLYYVGIELEILNYWVDFTFIDMLISACILGVAYFIIHRECKRISNEWKDFK